VALLSTRRSNVVVMGHEGGRRNLIRFLRASGAAELAERVVVVPFTIGASFLECQVPARKQDRIVAIGRWNDPQKHARLLARSLEAVLQRRPQTEVEIMGGGGEEYFAALAARWDRLRYSGARRQVEVADSLAASRSIVFSSRWEGCPHAAIEALSLGATVVGTPLPSLASWAQDGRFGRVAAHHTPGSLSGAIEHELSAWDRGERDADAISRHWRDLVRPERVCRELLGSIDL
jgi:glycosyltransferase involved in cell wall biosynthesis